MFVYGKSNSLTAIRRQFSVPPEVRQARVQFLSLLGVGVKDVQRGFLRVLTARRMAGKAEQAKFLAALRAREQQQDEG